MNSDHTTSTCPVKINRLCLIGLRSCGNKQLAKITDEAQESDCLNPSSYDDLGDDSTRILATGLKSQKNYTIGKSLSYEN